MLLRVWTAEVEKEGVEEEESEERDTAVEEEKRTMDKEEEEEEKEKEEEEEEAAEDQWRLSSQAMWQQPQSKAATDSGSR